MVRRATAEKCSICMERPANTTNDSCAHSFCYRCIAKWAKVFATLWKKKNNCPICRKHFSKIYWGKKVKEIPASKNQPVATVRPQIPNRRIVLLPVYLYSLLPEVSYPQQLPLTYSCNSYSIFNPLTMCVRLN